MAGTMMKPPPTPMIDGSKPIISAEHEHRDDADIELGCLEPHLEAAAVDPVCAPGRRRLTGAPAAARRSARTLSTIISAADGAEKADVEERDHQIELAELAQDARRSRRRRGAGDAADQQHRAELHVDRAALEMRQHAGNGRGDDLVGAGRHRHGRRDVVEDQQRRDQEAAADAEHAGEEPDRGAHQERTKAFTDISAMGR